MQKLLRALPILVLLLEISTLAGAAEVLTKNMEKGSDGPPTPFVDKGACPFEGCQYQEWLVQKNTVLYKTIASKTITGTAVKGEKVTGITGEVHTIPGKIKIIKDHNQYKNGDDLYVLTYEGEGSYKVWHKGNIRSDDTVYILFNEADGNITLFEKKLAGWGKVERRPESVWWVQVKLKNGEVGWTQETNHLNLDRYE